MSQAAWLIPTLLLVGVAVAAVFRRAYPNAFVDALLAQCLIFPLVLALAFIAPLRRTTRKFIDWLRHPTPSRRSITSFLIGIAAFGYLLTSATIHNRDLTPRLQDEFSYLIQAQLLARGRLWLPSPEPLADFFETFHVLVKPVYASVYFPGTAMLYAPSVWLHAPHHLIALGVTGLCAAILYLLATDMLDGAYGVLAAMMLVTTKIVRFNSTLALSNMPAMLASMLVVLAWLRWRRSGYSSPRWAAALGACAGWGMIVRPLDLGAYLIPLLVVTCGEALVRERRRIFLRCATLVMAAAVPFLTVQLMFNKGVTGEWLTTPYRYYFEQFQPNTTIGFPKDDPNLRVRSNLRQKVDLYELVLRPLIREHRWDTIWLLLKRSRLPFTIAATMPSDLLLAFLPLGAVAAMRDRRRAVLLAAPVLFLAMYALYPYFMWYYPLVIAPAVIMLILFGIHELLTWLTSIVHIQGESITTARMFLMLAPAALCIVALPEVRLQLGTEDEGIPTLQRVNRGLADVITPPAVVLFSYEPVPGIDQTSTAASVHIEPVYNYDVANPLDAPVIRAHDLGPLRNRDIFDYFARLRPQTMFYRMHRAQSFTLERLGRADELAARADVDAPAPPATGR